MRIIQNKYIPFGKRYLAVNLFGIVFAKGVLNPVTRNHEYIHTLQQREMLFLFFYIWYVLEWVIRLIRHRSFAKAYYAISFEREAYAHQKNLFYRHERKRFAWFKFLYMGNSTTKQAPSW